MTITEWEAVLALPVEPARDHIRGPLDAPASLVEFGDYECPYCGAAYPIVEEITRPCGLRLPATNRAFTTPSLFRISTFCLPGPIVSRIGVIVH
jgi:hypothetical protein